MSFTIEQLFLVTFCLVDDWYRTKGIHLVGRTVGSKPDFSDSEMLTLMLAIEFFEFTSERRYLAFIVANYRYLFPNILDQSQYNRRARSLRFLLNELRKEWIFQMDLQFAKHFLLDTTPVIAVGYRRDKSHSQFLESADYGFCAARKMKYYGYKLVMLTTLDGIPYSFDLVPANTDEREAADTVLHSLLPGSNAWADKGFIGVEWKAGWKESGINVWTAMRENQHQQNPTEFDQLLNRVRQMVETTFDILKEGGRSVEKTLAKTIDGLVSRIIAKISAVTLRVVLKKYFGINALTYKAA
jgi:Transposase DDE domain